jgi:hypothetical protein
MVQKNYEGRIRRMKLLGPVKKLLGPLHLLTGFAGLALSATAMGQVMQPPGTFPHPHRQHAQVAATPVSATVPAAAPVATPTTAPSLLDQPAQPAKVSLDAGHLAIQADNSNLSDILRQVSTASGMTVDGLGQDDRGQRIFGSYGPGDPHAVLSALLDGSGYNVMMLGETAAGTPRQLTLTPRGAAKASNGPNRLAAPVQDDDSEDEVQQQPPQQPDPQPVVTPAPANPTPAPQNGVRTPQQMLQELQQMRQQQQQQQDQQQPAPQ